jgi:hypothetical protein
MGGQHGRDRTIGNAWRSACKRAPGRHGMGTHPAGDPTTGEGAVHGARQPLGGRSTLAGTSTRLPLFKPWHALCTSGDQLLVPENSFDHRRPSRCPHSTCTSAPMDGEWSSERIVETAKISRMGQAKCASVAQLSPAHPVITGFFRHHLSRRFL